LSAMSGSCKAACRGAGSPSANGRWSRSWSGTTPPSFNMAIKACRRTQHVFYNRRSIHSTGVAIYRSCSSNFARAWYQLRCRSWRALTTSHEISPATRTHLCVGSVLLRVGNWRRWSPRSHSVSAGTTMGPFLHESPVFIDRGAPFWLPCPST